LRNTFSGIYYKHQKGENIVSVIAGASAKEHSFIQIISSKESYYFKFPYSKPSELFKIGNNTFSTNGMIISIEENDALIYGEIKYSELTPLRYDIMGPFRYVPMQCKHKILSLHHRLNGSLSICGETIDFDGGAGYIEGDFGTSFPKNYIWIQCSDFQENACIVASVADIPFSGLCFRGCICVVSINGVEYRMATYLGVRILCCCEHRIVLKQGSLYLEIEINAGTGQKLIAPENGGMVREIRECIMCGAHFRFIADGKVLFDQSSDKASFEFAD